MLNGHRVTFVASAILLLAGGAPALAKPPKVVEVPIGPAFVKLPGKQEIKARNGQSLQPATLLRTSKPGRMHVMLSNGREFRFGGDSQLKLTGPGVELLKGSIIGWVRPNTTNRRPFEIKTRLATASIQGTTVFLELNDDSFRVFSWEGRVQVRTQSGLEFILESGQQLLLDLSRQLNEVRGRLDGLDAVLGGSGGIVFPDSMDEEYGEPERSDADDEEEVGWDSPESMREIEVRRRLSGSPLINGFSTPLDTLPEIERELGVSAPTYNR